MATTHSRNGERSGGLRQMFVEHPRSLGMSWAEHGAGAVRIGARMVGAGLACMALNDALFLQSTQMTHGGGLTGKAEMALNLASGGHHSMLELIILEEVQELELAPTNEDTSGPRSSSSRCRPNGSVA